MYEEKYMKVALKEAKKAYLVGEVPIGAVIVKNNVIIGKGYNKKEFKNCSLEHAELNAIKQASKKIKNWRLDGSSIYITLEPCPMCTSAIYQSRIDNIYYGAKSLNTNNSEVIEKILGDNFSNSSKIKIEFINNTVCSKLISDFFKKKRIK